MAPWVGSTGRTVALQLLHRFCLQQYRVTSIAYASASSGARPECCVCSHQLAFLRCAFESSHAGEALHVHDGEISAG